MNYLPTSCLVLFFFFFSLHTLPCSSWKEEHEGCEALFQCGNITAGFPFWGGDRPRACGHPLLELHCYNNSTSLFISHQEYHIFHVNQTSTTLRIVKKNLLDSICTSSFTNKTLLPETFELSQDYKGLTVFYPCFPSRHADSRYACPGLGPIAESESPGYTEICHDSFTANIPKSFVPEEKQLNLTHWESALGDFFEVKVKINVKLCQECPSSYGFCGFNIFSPLEVICRPLSPPTANELHKLCNQTFSCGNQRDLFYPFWNHGREDCGHPDFKLDCSGPFAEFSVSSVKFRILAMTSRIIKLVRSDFIDDLCPSYPPDELFNISVLPLAPNTEMLTIYFDCKLDFTPFLSPFGGKINCPDDENDDKTNYYLTRNLSSTQLQPIRDQLNDFRRFCDRNVSIPANGQALIRLQGNSSEDNLKKALTDGFELGLDQECVACLASSGACGYNLTSDIFACYFIETQNKDAGLSTGAKAGLSTGAKAGIGIASGFLVVIIILAVLFFLIRRRKKTQEAQFTSKDLPTTSYSSRETSRNPTSTTFSSSSNHSLLPSMSNLANGNVYYGVQVFSYEELEEATDNFSRELGDGGFGTVYYGVLKDGRAVAVKRLYERSLKHVEQFKNEIEILKSLKHPNLVILYGCTSRHSRELLLVYEYISNGTVAEHLHGVRAEPHPLSWSVRLNVAIETASALSFLHAKGIIHRDVKTTNILLDDDYRVKVADFGLSRLFPMDQTHISTAPQGTPGYVDPQYHQCYQLNEKSDVYSFGVVLTELISSKEAVDITRHRHDINLANMAVSKIQNNALHELVDPSLGFEKDPEVRRKMMSVAELVFRCLQQEREVRPSMDEIVEILKGIKVEKNREMESSPDVVDIEGNCGGGDDVGLLRHSVPPPISPETDKWTSSSDREASL